MLQVGLTGGIAAGKSEAATRLAGLGAVVIDADQLAREVVAPGTDGLAAVVAAFGAEVLGADGALDRTRLARDVFGDGEARRHLEKIIHPRVRARTAELVAAAPERAVVVNDVPLLVEVGLAPTYHLVLVVEAPSAVRVARLVAGRGMSERDANARIAAQIDDVRRRAAADVVLDGGHEPSRLHAQLDALWQERLLPYEANVWHHRAPTAEGRAHLVPFDPAWAAQYERIAARLRHVMGAYALRVDHVGSTAIGGIAAKDVIDVQVTVADLADADAMRPALEAAGFVRPPGEFADNPKAWQPDPARWRKRFHRLVDPGRPANIHLRQVDSPGWRYALLFRDWLRALPAEADAYQAEKFRLAGTTATVEDYAEAKEPWFDAAAARAEEWAAATGWMP